MSQPEAQYWNARYLADQQHYLKREPHTLVKSYADQLPREGLVLDVAAGAAQSGLFLAKRGLRVVAMDISEAGLRLAQQCARELSLPLYPVIMDMKDPYLPSCKFDVILNFYYLSRPLFECYRQALKPGGWLFFETFIQNGDKSSNPAHRLELGELHFAFQDWEILHWAETWRKQSDGTFFSTRIAQLVARKPI